MKYKLTMHVYYIEYVMDANSFETRQLLSLLDDKTLILDYKSSLCSSNHRCFYAVVS